MLRDYLLTRRSVGMAFLKEPGPNAEELEQILTIGTRVPDHGKITPWRLVVIAGDARAQAGEKLAEIFAHNNPGMDEASIEIERQRFLPAPLTIGVISSPKAHPKVPEFEQLLSAGNVAFNLLHAAFALGFAASWITRWYTFDAEAASMLGAGEGERFVGFVHIGTPTAVIEDRPRPALADIVSHWTGDQD
ncbi:MAG: nitroreductase [Alphaproteobacteria bacterium]|nr:nitroreductase [Alphaproteobacteria bacterium]MBU1559520.1 nitroreductase [Alphaproteobacteria bacterium]MBU2301572.1 nitroreductase [Alphaproteobacteria bacterium]MBU2369699.1 nitroreductase [Alphaproteobacteria bacterium]